MRTFRFDLALCKTVKSCASAKFENSKSISNLTIAIPYPDKTRDVICSVARRFDGSPSCEMQQTSQQPTEKPSVTAEADAKTVVVEHGEERESWPFRKAMIYLFSTESAEVPWHPECAMCGRYYESRRVFSFMTPTKESGLNGKQFDLVCHDCAFERGFTVSGVTVSERSDFLTVLEWLYQDDETVGHSRTRFGRIAFNIELGRVGASHERELCFCWR